MTNTKILIKIRTGIQDKPQTPSSLNNEYLKQQIEIRFERHTDWFKPIRCRSLLLDH